MIDAVRGNNSPPAPAATQAPPRPAGETIEPFFFGSDDGPLYGCLHRAPSRSTRRCGVVLCQPFGPEYVRSHRAMRQLAARLSRAGCDVLRFDFFGCGDSAGDDSQGNVPQWVRDVHSAVDVLRQRAEVDETVVIGLRLGASLAALAGAERRGIDRLVVWDPVVDGCAHLEELCERHERQLEFLPARSGGRAAAPAANDASAEILGFHVGEDLITTLSRLDLLRIVQAPAAHVLVIASQPDIAANTLADHLRAAGARVEHRRVPDHEIWSAAPDRSVVPGQVLQNIVSWVSRSER